MFNIGSEWEIILSIPFQLNEKTRLDPYQQMYRKVLVRCLEKLTFFSTLKLMHTLKN